MRIIPDKYNERTKDLNLSCVILLYTNLPFESLFDLGTKITADYRSQLIAMKIRQIRWI